MKRLTFYISLILAPYLISGQTGVVNNGAKINISSGAYLMLSGGNTAGYTNNGNGQIDLEGQINITGNWVNNSSGNQVFTNINSTGIVNFNGSSQQTIGGSYATTFENLTLNNASGFVLGNHENVFNTFYMTSGITDLSSYNLTIGSINNLTGTFSSSNMLVANGTGEFRFTPVTGSWKYIPIGDNNGTTDYTPIRIYFTSLTPGANPKVNARTINSMHPYNSSGTSYLNRYWVMSSTDISSMSAYMYAYYKISDVAGTETNIKPGYYISPFWKQGSSINTTSHYLYFSGMTSLAELTGGEASAFATSISISNASAITEGSENGKKINVTVTNGEFVALPSLANWAIYNLPGGVSVSDIDRIDAHQVQLILSGYRTTDYDIDISNTEVWVNSNDVINLSSGSWIYDNTGVTFTATNDAESLSLSYNSPITEGAEDGEEIYVTLNGGTFTNPINAGSWTLLNLPDGVSYTIARTGNTTATITLVGNTTEDYDVNITDFTVTIPAADIDDYTSTSLSVSTGVVFTAIVESLTLTMASDGLISEKHENGEVITITISGRDFVPTLDSSKWTVNNLPAGVNWRSLTRLSNSQAQLLLSGNRTIDYDNNLTNLSVRIATGQIVDYTHDALVSTGVVFTANNDAETISITLPSPINEGSENGKTISVGLTGGTFYSSLNKNLWNISNLPEGVTIDTVIYNDTNSVTVSLSGYSTIDYDANIDLNLSIDKTQLADVSSNINISGQEYLTANNDAETLSMSGTFSEGNEDGGIISVTLTGGTFVSSISMVEVSLTNLPVGVELGSVTYVNSTHLTLELSGNATTDYDTDITNATLSINGNGYNDGSATIQTSTGVTFDATDEPVTATISSISIFEGNEDAKVLLVTITQDNLAATLNASNCIVHNLPAGVTAGGFNRVSNLEVDITLSGNRTIDFDTDISNIYVELTSSALTQHNYAVNSNNITIIATNDAEQLASTQSTINEGSENNATVTITLSGGTFVSNFTKENWILSGAPTGVTIGSVTRNSSTEAIVTLSGNSTVDYDTDISATLSIKQDEIDDYTGSNLTVANGINFTATVESVYIQLANYLGNTIDEGFENGAAIEVTLFNDIFVTTLDQDFWIVSNLPVGVSLGSIGRSDNTHAVIYLSGNRTRDYDSNITNIQVDIDGNQFVNQNIDASANSGVTLTALNDAESFAFITNSITERTENNATIDIILSGGTFVNPLNAANWSISGHPSGITLYSASYISANTARLTLAGNSTTDYDVDLTSFQATADYTQVDDHESAEGDITASGGITFLALVESLNYTPLVSPLTEANVNGVSFDLTLVNDQFVDFGLDVSNFVINNAPAGISVSAVQYETSTTAKIYVSYDGTDFDTDFTNVTLSIKAAELMSASMLTTSAFSITALIEMPFIALSDNTIYEGSENSGLIYIDLYEDEFIALPDIASWQINNLPAGVTANYIDRTSNTRLTLHLTGIRAIDYDNNMTNFSISIPANQLVAGLSNVSASSGVVFIANNDEESIAFTPVNIDEGSENGAVITVILTGGTFAPVLNISNWELLNLPSGVSLFTVSRISSTRADITLAGIREFDYDEDITNLTLNVNNAEIDDYNSGKLTANTGVVFIAKNERVAISQNNVNEASLDGFTITLSLTDETFINNPAQLANFKILNGSPGLSVGSVTYLNSSEVSLVFNYAGYDFDSDIDFQIEILSNEIAGVASLITETITAVALDDTEVITMDDDADGIWEGSELNEVITVSISGGTFAQNINATNWHFENMPSGINYELVRKDNITLEITLTSNTTVDYDSDINNVQLIISSQEIDDYNGADFAISSGVSFKAYDELLAISASPSLTETNLNGAIISLELTNELFTDNTLDISNFTLDNAPYGLSISNVVYNSSTQATISLAFDGTDFDSNISNFSITIKESEIRGKANLTSNTLTITAIDEPEKINISHSGLTENNLDNALIEISLTMVTFVDGILDPSNFTIIGAPVGCQIYSVSYISATQAELVLSFNNTDFDHDYSLEVNIKAAELSSSTNISSNALPISCINDPETIELSSINEITEGSENGQVFNIALIGGEFTINLDMASWQISNLPVGLSLTNMQLINDQLLLVDISGNRLIDYDTDISVSITIPQNQVNEAESDVQTTVPLIFHSINDDESFVMFDDGLIEEGAENNEVITVHLNGGTFVSGILNGYFSFTNLPMGVYITNVVRNSSSEVQLTLAGNTLVDYDTIIHPSLIISQLAFDDYLGDDITLSQGVSLTGHYEPNDRLLIIADTIINEHEIDGYILQFNLVHESFSNSTADLNHYTLVGNPAGLTVSSVDILSPTIGQLHLAYNWTDFDLDIDSISLTIEASELQMGVGLQSNLLTLQAVIESRSMLAVSDSLSELNLDGQIITLHLYEDFIKDNSLQVSNFTLNNAPQGCTIRSVNYIDSLTTEITLQYNGTDFDTDITNLSVTVKGNELDNNTDLTSNYLYIGAYIENPTLTATSGTLSEKFLNGAGITISMHENRFMTTPSISDLIISGGPAGLTVDHLTITNDSIASVYLAFDGSDFDADFTNFIITIKGSVLHSNENLSSNPLVISAYIEHPSLTMNATGINEQNVDGLQITLMLHDEKFASTASIIGLTLSGAPAGLTIGQFNVLTDSTATVVFAFDGTDFDADSTHVIITIAGTALHSGNPVSSNQITISAINEDGTISASTNTPLDENNLDETKVQLKLHGIKLINPVLADGNLTLNGGPVGLVIASENVITDTTIEITLAYNGSDFDSNFNHLCFTLKANEHNGIGDQTSNTLLITAINDAESVSIESTAPIYEGSENGSEITVTLTGGTFTATIDASLWSLSYLPVGVSIDSIHRVNNQQAVIKLANNSQSDYDTDMLASLAIDESQIDDYTGDPLISTNTVTFIALIENPVLNLASTSGQLTELNLNSSQVQLIIHGAEFIAPVGIKDDIGFIGAPSGLHYESFEIVDDTLMNISLRFDGTDFDTGFDFAMAIAPSLTTHDDTLLSNTIYVIASIEPAVSTIPVTIAEGFENGQQIVLTLTEGSFNPSVTVVDFQPDSLPVGVSVNNVAISNDKVKATLMLGGTRSTDFDSDIEAGQLIIQPEAFEKYLGGPVVINSQVTFKAKNESVAAYHQGLTEQNLNGAVIALTFTDDWLTNLLPGIDQFMLLNAPAGTTISEVSVIDSAHSSLTLSFDGTDFTTDIPDFKIEVAQSAIFGLTNVISNELVIDEGNSISDWAKKWGLKIYASQANVYITFDKIPDPWKSASIQVYDAQARLILETDLNKNRVNIVPINALTGNYVVRTKINNKSIVQKIFIISE